MKTSLSPKVLIPICIVPIMTFSSFGDETPARSQPAANSPGKGGQGDGTAAAPPAVRPWLSIDREISLLEKRVETLLKEEQAWKAKGAADKELEGLRTRREQTELKLKEWKDRRAKGETEMKPAAPPEGAGQGKGKAQAPAPWRNPYEIDAPELYPGQAPAPPADWIEPASPTADARALFEKRILPIFNSAKPSSCTECHLSGVELKDYIFPDQAKTFAALVRGRMVNLEHPEDSKILEFISRRPEKPGLIGDQVRREEYQAFRAWLLAAVKDPALQSAKEHGTAAAYTVSNEVIRHARTDRVLASFIENVWIEMKRCDHCHSSDMNQHQVKRHGEWMSWIKPGDPMGTLQYLADSKLINVHSPEKSLLLTKPTNEEEHGGGPKMIKGDRSYKQFRTFVEDFAAITKGEYRRPDQLPGASEELARPAPIWLRITDIPARYAKKPMQVDVYPWTPEGWSRDRVATSMWFVFEKARSWQFNLTLTRHRSVAASATPELPAGRYLLKLYVDEHGKLDRDPMAPLGEAELVAAVEIESAWPAGAPKDHATVVKFPSTQTASRPAGD